MKNIRVFYVFMIAFLIVGCAPKTYNFQLSESGKSFFLEGKDTFDFTFYKQYDPPIVRGTKDKAIAIILYRDKLDRTYYDVGFFIDMREKPYKVVGLFERHENMANIPKVDFTYAYEETSPKSKFNFLFKTYEFLIADGYPKIYIKWDPLEVGMIKGRFFTKGAIHSLIITKESTKKEKEIFWDYANHVIRAEKQRINNRYTTMSALDRYAMSVMSNISTQLGSVISSSSTSNSVKNSSNADSSIRIVRCQPSNGDTACDILVDGNYKGRIFYTEGLSNHSYQISTVGSPYTAHGYYNTSSQRLHTQECGEVSVSNIHSALEKFMECAVKGDY